MRRALVTGAGGFVGRVLCAALGRAGVEVTAAVRRPAPGPWHHLWAGDLAEQAPGDEVLASVDCVFHLAGHAHAAAAPDDEERHRRDTVQATARLLAACEPFRPRLVYTSSVKAMGEHTPPEGLDESAPPRPAGAYGRARLEAESMVLGHAARMHASVLRLPLVYGPGVRGNLRRMLCAVRAGRMPLLPEFGNRRSLVHVEDVAAAAMAAATRDIARGRVYLITDGRDYGSREIQRLMYEAAGRRPILRIPAWALRVAAAGGDGLRRLGVARVPFDGEALTKLAANARYDSTRARRELDFRPRHDLAGALPAMLAALDREAVP